MLDAGRWMGARAPRGGDAEDGASRGWANGGERLRLDLLD
jgi:hypothetical protein